MFNFLSDQFYEVSLKLFSTTCISCHVACVGPSKRSGENVGCWSLLPRSVLHVLQEKKCPLWVAKREKKKLTFGDLED